jgi:hypothetical protein
MPVIKSHADLFRDWEKLEAACRDNLDLLTSAEPLRLAVESLLTRGRELKNRQDSLTAQKQLATQELELVKEEGREATRRLRGAVKSILGTRNELLVQFNVKPLRPRKARKATPPPTTPGFETFETLPDTTQ